jgi:hypothetical protein
MKIKYKHRLANAVGLVSVVALFSGLVGWLWVPLLIQLKVCLSLFLLA